MSFHGCVESISQTRITGWAHYLADGKPAPVGLTLRFWNAGSVAPTSTHVRGDGVIGFVFELGAQYQSFTWAKFIDEFRAVEATFETDSGVQRWDVPLFISILKPYDNRTALVGKLRDYSLAPKPDGRIACFTMVYNEYAMLPLWARYYAKVFGAENLYVLDHGSDKPYEDLPEGITVISLPRDQFDNWLIARIAGFFQRFLLESYDSVLYTDSDEFVCASPEVLGGKALAEFLLGLDPPIGITRGFNLYHDVLNEPTYDPSRPLLEQRRVLVREPMMDKPLIARVPVSWVAGFHKAHEGGVSIPGLYMLHLRWFDLDAALIKGGHYRSSKWNPFDVATDLAAYQRADEQQIVRQFQDRAKSFASLKTAVFDDNARETVVPAWMRDAIVV